MLTYAAMPPFGCAKLRPGCVMSIMPSHWTLVARLDARTGMAAAWMPCFTAGPMPPPLGPAVLHRRPETKPRRLHGLSVCSPVCSRSRLLARERGRLLEHACRRERLTETSYGSDPDVIVN